MKSTLDPFLPLIASVNLLSIEQYQNMIILEKKFKK